MNRLADHIVTPGQRVREITISEGANPAKVSVIPYAYEFEQMRQSVDPARVAELREEFPARLRLIAVMRFVPMKRHSLALETLAALVERGYDVNLTLLGVGPEIEQIQKLARRLEVAGRVRFLGFSKEVLAQLAASDLVLCPSLEDASNSAIKEAGLMRRPVVVVEGVGDFDDYVRDGYNGFLVRSGEFVARAVAAAIGLLDGTYDGQRMGERLEGSVRENFTVSSRIVDMYEVLLEKVCTG